MTEDYVFRTESVDGLNLLLEEMFERKGMDSVELNDGQGSAMVLSRDLYEVIKSQLPEEERSKLGIKVLDALERINTVAVPIDVNKPVVIDELSFHRMMKGAKVKMIDPNSSPGTDINGNPFNINGLTLILSQQYPDALKAMPRELGAMVDPKGRKQAFRLIEAKSGGQHDGDEKDTSQEKGGS